MDIKPINTINAKLIAINARLNMDDIDVVYEVIEHIERLETALWAIAGAVPECCIISNAMQGIARKALEGKND